MKIWNCNFKKRIIFVFFVLIMFSFFLNQESYAKGSFRTIRHLPDCDGQMPVKLNDNEIFFPGNWRSTAKILKVDEEKFVDLNVKMHVPREFYHTLKLDKDNIIIASGHTVTLDDNRRREASSSIEIYNLKTNKFTLFKNAPIERGSIFLNKDEIFTFYRDDIGNYFRIFNVKTKTLESIGENFFDRTTKEGREAFVTVRDFNSEIYYKFPINILLDDGRVFIYETEVYDDDEVTLDAAELYDHKTKTFEKISLPNGIRLHTTNVKLDNGKLLFFGPDCKGGTEIIEFDPKTNKFKEYDKLNFMVKESQAILLNDDKILLIHGITNWVGKYKLRNELLESAIYDVKNKKISKVKKTTKVPYWLWTHLIKIGNDKVFLFESRRKIKVYEY